MGWVITSRNRILSTYSGKSAVVNATGTGTQIELRPSATLSSSERNRMEEMFNNLFQAPQLTITALADQGSPFVVNSTDIGEVRVAAGGRPILLKAINTIPVSISVIGNSIDDYNLTRLGNYLHMNNDMSNPMLDMSIVSYSAPGYNITFRDGFMLDAALGISIQGNARISCKTFNFEFMNSSNPNKKDQYFDNSSIETILGM